MSAVADSALAALLEPLCDVLADKLAMRLERGQARLVSQSRSELGPRQHRAAVQRRIANDEGGAYIRGRKHLLTLEAYHDELARGQAPTKERKVRKAPAVMTGPSSGDFERELVAGLRRVQGRR
jgi:hypothetical protein